MSLNKNKANFIIIGAAKAGTTSLYKRLSMHPSVFMTIPKEPEFFARDDVYSNGEEWYNDLFSSAKENQICGEASTLYSLTSSFPETVRRMHDLLPDAKIIYVVRDPVDRAYSYYTQLLKNYQNSTRDFSINRTIEECLFPDCYPNRQSRDKFFASFDSHLSDIPNTITDGGMYMTVINDYLRFYPRKNLLLIKFEDLANDLDAVVADVCEFLAIDNSVFPNNELVRENVSSEHFVTVDKEAYKQSVIARLKLNPFIFRISTFVPRHIRQTFIAWYVHLVPSGSPITIRPEKMSDTTRTYLKDFYRMDIEKLEDFWGENLESWK